MEHGQGKTFLDLNASHWRGLLLAATLVMALHVSIASQQPLLENPDLFIDDARIHVAWAHKLYDPELFQNDEVIRLSQVQASPGYAFIYRVTATLDDLMRAFGSENLAEVADEYLNPLTVSKFLPIILCLTTAIYLFNIGREIKGNLAGFLISNLFIFTCYYLLADGLQRSFSVPLFIIFFYYLLKKNSVKISVALVLSALLYPPVFLISALALFICLIFEKKSISYFVKPDRELLILSAGMAAGLFILVLNTFLLDKPEVYFTRYTPWSEITSSPLYLPGGRHVMFKKIPEPFLFLPYHPLEVSSRLHMGVVYGGTGILVGLAGLLLLLRKFRPTLPPREPWCALASGVILYFAALALMFLLYFPSRYFYIPWLVFVLCFIAVNFEDAVARVWNFARKRSRGAPGRAPYHVFLIPVLIAGLASAYEIGYFSGYQAPKGVETAAACPQMKNLLSFLGGLPKDALIAGPPEIMDFVPLVSRRSVYCTEEAQDFSPELSRRAREFFTAYFAEDFTAVERFCTRENIDYLVVDKSKFKEGFSYRDFYYKPYRSLVTELYERADRFALESPPPELVVYSFGDYTVLKCGLGR